MGMPPDHPRSALIGALAFRPARAGGVHG